MIQNIKIAFLGDISLNDKYIDYYRQGLNPFENMQPYLHSHDFIIGNLECMVKGEHGENELKKPRLSTNIETLNYLNMIRLNVATLANNHIYDHLQDGFSNTVNFLETNGIRYLGAGYSIEQAARPVIISKSDCKIGILNYATADTNPSLPPNASIHLNLFSLEKAERDIKELAKFVDWIVILMHWGGRVEGGLFPDFDQPAIGKKMIDFGADAIIGHHSHTIQPFTQYKHKYIFYSLGNFCFSNKLSHFVGNAIPWRGKITGILSLELEKGKHTFRFNFYKNEGTSFQALPKHHKILNLQNSIYRILFLHKCIWYIYFFHKKYILPLTLFLVRRDITFFNKFTRLFNSLWRRLK